MPVYTLSHILRKEEEIYVDGYYCDIWTISS